MTVTIPELIARAARAVSRAANFHISPVATIAFLVGVFLLFLASLMP